MPIKSNFSLAGNDPASLQRELQKIRHDSLIATRQGDYRKVAQLTQQAAQLNEAIAEAADGYMHDSVRSAGFR